jgi:3-oxoacyl-[acyl-carrier protein] reductase
MTLIGKTAIITGGSGSIGSAIALSLAEQGCNVALLDLAAAEGAAASIRSVGRTAHVCSIDLTNTANTQAVIREAVEALGGLDILVNAAGIVSTGSLSSLAEEEWDRVIEINLKSVFICCQAAIDPLKQRGSGRIINIGSVLGKNGGNARPWSDPSEQERSGNVAYGVSKAGVHMLTSYLARELAAFNITVNAVAPGPIATAMTADLPDSLKALIPVGRMGKPEDVAAAVAFLASDSAAFITGEILDVNGGLWSD